MKISVIVPVYNSEMYVGRCIDSIIMQTYPNWELILVDDGSMDNSLAVLREYEKQDSRIKVISQDNAGPGIARNTGIAHATGDYVVFVDSDDRISKNYFFLLSKKNEDVIFIDIDQVDETFCILKTEHMSDYSALSKDAFLRQQMTGKINWGGVRKAVKRKLLTDNNILYSRHKIGEEAIYSFLILLNADTFSFINESVYEYINRAGSQSDYQMDDPWGGVSLELRKKLKKICEYEKYANTINAFIITAAIVSLDKMAGRYSYWVFRKYAIKRIRQCWNEVDKNYKVDFYSMDNKARFMYPFVRINLVTPVYIASFIKRRVRTILEMFV